MGIPVYNYDIYGGSGYISLENIDKEEFYNFSGRSHCRKLNYDDIICEIIGYYKKKSSHKPVNYKKLPAIDILYRRLWRIFYQ